MALLLVGGVACLGYKFTRKFVKPRCGVAQGCADNAVMLAALLARIPNLLETPFEPRGGVAQGCIGNAAMLAALLPSLGGGEREGGGCGPPRTTENSWPGLDKKWAISPLKVISGRPPKAPGQDLANGRPSCR